VKIVNTNGKNPCPALPIVCPIIDNTLLCLPSLILCHRFGTKVPFPPALTTWLPTILLPAVKILLLDTFVNEISLPPIRLGTNDTTSNCSNGLLLLFFLSIFPFFLKVFSCLRFLFLFSSPSNILLQTRTTTLRPRSASTMLPLQTRSGVVL